MREKGHQQLIRGLCHATVLAPVRDEIRTSFDELYNGTLYNKMRRGACNCSEYLDNLEIVTCDYKELHEQYKNRKEVVFLVDPPLSTDVKVYKCY